MQIHSEFRLNKYSFTNSKDLSDYCEKNFPKDSIFLSQLFDNKDFIIVQTSGSTGVPKPIKLFKKALLKSAEATGTYFGLNAGTKALHCISSQFIAGKMMWIRALHLGWHLTVVAASGNPLKQTNETFDFCAMVPLQAQNSLSELHRVKQLIIGGAPITYDLELKLTQIPTAVYLTYGMTETITHIAVKKMGGDDFFECLPNVTVSQDTRGCLRIQVPYIQKNKLVTNDLVELIDVQKFKWLGRIDNVINSGGVKLIPEQIEQKLQPYIAQPFLITSEPDEILGQKVILIIETQNHTENLSSIFEKALLTKFEIPKKVYFIPQFTRTENGKIDRKNTFLKINK